MICYRSWRPYPHGRPRRAPAGSGGRASLDRRPWEWLHWPQTCSYKSSRTNGVRIVKLIAIISFLTVVCTEFSSAELINTINFFGVNPKQDAEAEYRLHELGIDIVEAKRASTEVSLSMKHAYGASILGDIGTEHLENVDQRGQLLSMQWRHVAETSQQLQIWLTGKLRSDYSEAFCLVAKGDTDIVGSLIEVGASDFNQVWAFDHVGDLCREYDSPRRSNPIYVHRTSALRNNQRGVH